MSEPRTPGDPTDDDKTAAGPPEPDARGEDPWLPEFSEETFGPSPEFVEAVEEAVDQENLAKAEKLVQDLHAADAADGAGVAGSDSG